MACRMRTAFSGEVVTRCRSSNHCHLLGRAARDEQRGENVPERRVLLPQPWRINVIRASACSHLLLRTALAPPARVIRRRARVANALRMAHRIGDRDRASLRYAKQGETAASPAASTTVSRSRTKASNEMSSTFQSDRPLPRCVIADQPVLRGERVQQMAPDRALPVVFEMVEPIGRLDQGRAVAGERIGDANAV